jgi:hypothetical protein
MRGACHEFWGTREEVTDGLVFRVQQGRWGDVSTSALMLYRMWQMGQVLQPKLLFVNLLIG